MIYDEEYDRDKNASELLAIDSLVIRAGCCARSAAGSI